MAGDETIETRLDSFDPRMAADSFAHVGEGALRLLHRYDEAKKALANEGLAAKTESGPAQGTVTIADRAFGYAALQAPKLAPDTGVVVLRTEF